LARIKGVATILDADKGTPPPRPFPSNSRWSLLRGNGETRFKLKRKWMGTANLAVHPFDEETFLRSGYPPFCHQKEFNENVNLADQT
jgi:hypothetical protein